MSDLSNEREPPESSFSQTEKRADFGFLPRDHVRRDIFAENEQPAGLEPEFGAFVGEKRDRPCPRGTAGCVGAGWKKRDAKARIGTSTFKPNNKTLLPTANTLCRQS